MISLRKVLGFLVMLVIATFALPSSAGADKTYSLTIANATGAYPSPGEVAQVNGPGLTTIIRAVFRNQGPPGSISSFNSVTLAVPSGSNFLITKVTPPPGNGKLSTPIPTGGGLTTIKIEKMSPQQVSSSPYVLTVEIKNNNVASASDCTGSPFGPWTSTASTGSGNTNQNFNLATEPPQINWLSMASKAQCSLVFLTQPKNALAGAIITNTPYNNPPGQVVKVELQINGSTSVDYDRSVSLTSSCAPATNTALTGNTVTSSSGVASFSNLTSAAGSSCTLTASASEFGSVTSSAFNVTSPSGDIFCDAPLPPLVTTPTLGLTINDPGYAEGSRGPHNKDGSFCVKVNYVFYNDITSNDTVQLRWDTTATGQPYAAFSYTANWMPVDVVNGFAPVQRPKVAWEFNADGTPKHKVLGVACMNPSLPAPFGALATSMNATDATPTITINVNATNPPSPALQLGGNFAPLPTVGSGSFPIVIGTERMVVTSVSAVGSIYTLTVARGGTCTSVANCPGGGTPMAAHPVGASPTYVMSTPLPIDPNEFKPDGSTANPYWKKQAQMCIWEHGWVTHTPNPLTGLPRVRYSTSAFDIGDGFMTND